MVIIVNKHAPEQVIKTLSKFGELVLFETHNITYLQISNHPDIFFCTGNNQLIAAPNTPEKFLSLLQKKGINAIIGNKPVGTAYPESAIYNAVVTNRFLIHNLSVTDPVVLKTFSHLEHINIPQGYGRCSLLPLKNNRFITSDRGIANVLKQKGMEVLYVNPHGIILPGFNNGFFGGTAGVLNNQVLLAGSLNHYNEGEKVRTFLEQGGYKIIELYNGPLLDTGSILFV